MRIAVNVQVTKLGDSVDNPETGTVEAISGQRAQVNWGWVTSWETLRSLIPVETDTQTGVADTQTPAEQRTMLDQLAEQVTATAGAAPAELIAELVALYREVALRQTDAGWWLNNRTYPLGPRHERMHPMTELTPYQRMTAVAEPKPFDGTPEGYEPHHWMAAPAGRPGAATQVITSDDMSYCTACRRWFRIAHNAWGKYAVGTDGELAISCPGYDWHGPDCNCFGHPQPQYLGGGGEYQPRT